MYVNGKVAQDKGDGYSLPRQHRGRCSSRRLDIDESDDQQIRIPIKTWGMYLREAWKTKKKGNIEPDK